MGRVAHDKRMGKKGAKANVLELLQIIYSNNSATQIIVNRRTFSFSSYGEEIADFLDDRVV